jgi:hypothetical protein
VDLNPFLFNNSFANNVSGGQQVGVGTPALGTGNQDALLWSGTAASVVDLHPNGFQSSFAFGNSGGQQVGFGALAQGGTHALLWSGSAASVVDLNPAGFDQSEALANSGGQQVGFGSSSADGHVHALLWNGTAASVEDLNAFLPSGFTDAEAVAIDATGDIVGDARGPASELNDHAFLWSTSVSAVPEPGTAALVVIGIPGIMLARKRRLPKLAFLVYWPSRARRTEGAVCSQQPLAIVKY